MTTDTGVYKPIETDYSYARPDTEGPLPAKATFDLAAMLRAVLAFKAIRVLGPSELPPGLTVVAGETLLLVIERVQFPIDLGGPPATLGVRHTIRLVVELQAIVGSVNGVTAAQAARLSQDIPNYVERAVTANGLLPDMDGNDQLTQAMRFADEGLHVYPYGYMPDSNRAALYRARRMRVEITTIFWMEALAHVG